MARYGLSCAHAKAQNTHKLNEIRNGLPVLKFAYSLKPEAGEPTMKSVASLRVVDSSGHAVSFAK